MKVEFKKVTWYSQVLAIVLGVLIFLVGFYLGGATSEQNITARAIEAIFSPERPVTFYKPIEYLPAQHNNGTITSQAELDKLYPESYSDALVTPGERFRKPGVNFEEYFIVYQQIFGSGCYIALTPTLTEVGNRKIIFDSQMHEEGACEMALTGVDWAVIPRAYLNHEITYTITATNSD